ncbi:hypothetical protein [Chitinophaga pinensis]|uniref:Uncharacterized protein n=1 Tax=Chitinophaga pinensis (strain ATCC 43595 / DSM 2588 / LMG 13176 / NBRC 15968 / NCIMB 11800 / UQM 2034) TaxID=485918 RepID=A0A979GM23_CHIPD|nr:hypothetical protein [Chitinophaga pinensis]ACU57667.1 hypothetical protein Cpin_0166 [Chitinophaga pinensis DSM 2588]
MNFGVKLFRVLNGIGIVMTSFLLLAFLRWMLQIGFIGAGLPVIFLGGVLIHAILANGVQKSLRNPELPVKDNTLNGVQILGFFPILIGLLVVATASMLNNPDWRDLVAKDLADQAVASAQKMPDGTIESSIVLGQILMTVYGIILVGNAVVAMIYVKQLRDRQNEDQNGNPDDIGA